MTDRLDRMSRRVFLRGSATAAFPDSSRRPSNETEVTTGADRLSRRMFLGAGAALALLAAAPPAWARSAVAAARSAVAARPKALTRSRFMPVLGATLRMSGGGEDRDVVLAEITDLSPVLRADDEDRFSLLLHAHGSHKPSSGIRTLQHASIGRVALFVHPVGGAVKPVHYQAVINRSRS